MRPTDAHLLKHLTAMHWYGGGTLALARPAQAAAGRGAVRASWSATGRPAAPDRWRRDGKAIARPPRLRLAHVRLTGWSRSTPARRRAMRGGTRAVSRACEASGRAISSRCAAVRARYADEPW